MTSNTKASQSKPRPERKGGSSPEPPTSHTDQEVASNGQRTSGHQLHHHALHTSHVLHGVPSKGSPASFNQPPIQSCGCCSDSSTNAQPSQNHTSVLSQESRSTEDLLVSGSGSAQGAIRSPQSTDQQRYGLHLPMTIDLYSPIRQWEAQTPAEDVWSTFVALENGARKPIGEEVDNERTWV